VRSTSCDSLVDKGGETPRRILAIVVSRAHAKQLCIKNLKVGVNTECNGTLHQMEICVRFKPLSLGRISRHAKASVLMQPRALLAMLADATALREKAGFPMVHEETAK
jgi:hypothetical protein